MKLHLPKLLFTAIVATAGMIHAEETDKAETITVDFHTGTTLPSTSSTYHTFDTTNVTLSTGDKLGAFDENGNTLTINPKQEYDKNGNLITAGNVTKNVYVEGKLTVESDAHVLLGGQYIAYQGILKSKKAEYTGIIADTLHVKDSAVVDSWNATVNTLQVDGGTVKIHNNGNSGSGNASIRVEDVVDSKQVRIKNFLIVNGGNVNIGKTGNVSMDDTHCQTGFGNGKISTPDYANSTITQSWIKQGIAENSTGGTLYVNGKSVSVGGLNIEQHSGTMSISDGNYHIIADNGIKYDSQVVQYGDAKLTIGGILAENKYKEYVAEYTQFGDAAFHVTQHGNGEINMTNGIVFNYNATSNADARSTFVQNGSGTINLKGTFGRTIDKTVTIQGIFGLGGGTITWADVYFDINQNGANGKINLQKDTKFSGGDISQTAAAELKLEDNVTMSALNVTQKGAGIIQVADGATLTANNIYAGTVEETFDAEGNVISRSGSVEISNALLTGGSLSTSDNKVTNTGTLSADSIAVKTDSTVQNEGFIIVNGAIVLTNGATLVNKGNITSSSSFALMTADEQAAVILSETEDLIILEEGSSLVNEGNIDKGILVQGGTLTLNDSGITQDITLESGTIYVTDSGVQTGSLTLNGGTINFSDGASVVLGEDDVLDLNGADIIVSVSDASSIETGSIVTLFGSTGTVSGLEGTEITFTDENNGKVTGTLTDAGNGSFTVTVVPEPATATLSLLALAGLAMRRRRK